MSKFKHNKKRNSAFLYEALIQELTKAVFEKNVEKQQAVLSMVKESFSKNTLMYKELKLYESLTKTKNVDELTAEKIINETKKQHSSINQKELIEEQNSLSRKISKQLSSSVFSNFVPNYKDLASVFQIFNSGVSVKSKILLENEVVKNMSSKKIEENKMVPIDNIVFKSFTKRFNEEYGDKLIKEQKELLNRYITSFGSSELDLNIYLNEEIGRLKKELKNSFNSEEFANDTQMLENAKKVLNTLDSYQEQKPNKKMIEEIVKIQGLVQELRPDVN
jgi:hypothetical protein